MPDNSSPIARFLRELQRRHVARVAFAYAAAAVLTLEGLEMVIPAFNLPERLLQTLVVVAVLGFPVAVVLAWVYDVTPQGVQKTEDSPPTGPPEAGLFPTVALLLVTVLSVAFVGWWALRADEAGTPAAASRETTVSAVPVSADALGPLRSIAVLPLDDFSEGGTEEYFAASMHEALVAELSQISELRVVSRTSVMAYAKTTKTMPEIAGELAVEGVIEGSVVRAGDQVRITVQLIHGPSDQHRWANSYQGDLSDMLGLQARVAQEIAAEVQAQLEPATPSRLASARTAAPEAQEAYLRGRYEQSKGTPEGLRAAIGHFETATRIDSAFAPAYTELAGAQVLLALGDTPESEDGIVEAEEAISRALELDPGSREALAVLSTLREVVRVHTADGDMRRVTLEIGPMGDSMGLDQDWVASATEFGRRMVRLDMQMDGPPVLRPERPAPAEVATIRQVRSLTAAGEYRQATEIVEGVLEKNPESAMAWETLRGLYLAVGDFEGATELEVRRAERVQDMARLAEAEALEDAVVEQGPEQYWRWLVNDLGEAEEAGRPTSPVDAAMGYAQLGDTDRAFALLDQALARRDPRLFSLQSNPMWDPLRTDPRFKELVSDLRDPAQFRRRPTRPTRDGSDAAG